MKKPLISIVVIFDKIRKEKLVRLLESMKNQLSLYPTEIVLIHESNTPLPTPELPVPVRYVTIPEKRGIPFNRNQGLQQARGEIIVFIDDDCWAQEKWLSSLVGPLLKDDTLFAVTSGTKIPHSTFFGDCVAALGFPGGGSLGFEKVWRVSAEGFTNHLAAGNCALRREVFDTIGYFDESLKWGAEDAEFSYRLERAGHLVKYAPTAFAYHEARTTLRSFVRWQLRRGRANFHLKKRIGPVGEFISLRLWSTKNIIKKNWHRPVFPLLFLLLAFSFFLQQLGYLFEAHRK